jgi:hypothetical protein
MANQIMHGFFDLADVFDQRVDVIGVDEVTQAVLATVAEHNRQLNALMGLFVQEHDGFKTRFQSVNATRLQPLDEFGRARKVQPSGFYEVSFPLLDAGIAWGQTFKAKAKMTVGEVNRTMNVITMADKRWMRDHILAALYANASYVYPDVDHGDLTIKGLANGDSDVYLIMAGQDMPAQDTHYLTQAAGISDAADPFPAIYAELTEHPENSGDVIAFIPTNLKSSVQNLASFYKQSDPKLRSGTGITELVGSLGLSVPGTVLGYHDSGVWIVEWPIMPNDRIVAVTVGGDRPVAMRQEPEAQLRGFQAVADRDDYPYYERQYVRTAGFGAWNRVGAVVYQVGNATYSIPTGYSSPMP